MTRLALVLGVAHAVLAVSVFGSAIAYPARASLLPIVMFCADLPFSLMFEFISKHLDSVFDARLLIDAILYTVVGSAWFLAIGQFVSKLLTLK